MGKKGSNKDKCKAYRAEARREKNKVRKLRKHVRAFPNDFAAARALERLR